MKTILERLERGEISARQALGELTAGGADPGFASESVFIALGGSDLVEVGPDGRERYHPSGRLVREVEADLTR